MKVKIRIFGLTPHDDGEADAFTMEFPHLNYVLDKNRQYSVDDIDALIHKDGAPRGSVAHVIASSMRAALECETVGDVTVEELYEAQVSTGGVDLFSAFRLPPDAWDKQYVKPVGKVSTYGAYAHLAYPHLKTDKQIYNAFMNGEISQEDCDQLLKLVDREGNAAKFRKDNPQYD